MYQHALDRFFANKSRLEANVQLLYNSILTHACPNSIVFSSFFYGQFLSDVPNHIITFDIFIKQRFIEDQSALMELYIPMKRKIEKNLVTEPVCCLILLCFVARQKHMASHVVQFLKDTCDLIKINTISILLCMPCKPQVKISKYMQNRVEIFAKFIDTHKW